MQPERAPVHTPSPEIIMLQNDPLLSLSAGGAMAQASTPGGVPGVLTLADGAQYGLVPLDLLLGGGMGGGGQRGGLGGLGGLLLGGVGGASGGFKGGVRTATGPVLA